MKDRTGFDTARLAADIALARGQGRVDLLVKNARLVNVLSGEIHPADVAVAGGRVIGFGDYQSEEVLDAAGRFLCPGLIDGHIHIESSLLSPPEFARAVAPHGTAAVVCDPHEIANVRGLDGVEYMLEASRLLPVSVFFMASSCVPATHMETSGAEISASDIAGLFKRHPDRVLGLAEVMNFPGVLAGRPEVLAKIAAAGPRPVDGHAPLLSGRDLCAYVLAGPGSEHEASGPDEAREKLRAGMQLMIREGSTEHNLADLVPVVNEFNSCRVSLVSDDRSAGDLMRLGHMDHSLRLAMAHGVPPMRAVQMASVNTARYFGLRGRGAVAPGYRADFLLLDDLEEFSISEVFLAGRNVRDLDFPAGRRRGLKNTMNVSGLCPESFGLAPGRGRIRVIGFTPGQVITESLVLEPRLVDGRPEADPSRDLAKLAVIERHQGSGKVGLGFVHGLGLVQGALASTVAHDSHNLIVAGVKDKDMLAAARECVRMGGGLAAAAGGRVLASLALPIAGLMSDRPLSEVARGFDAVLGAARDLCPGLESPFAALSFLALPVIPFLKLTDQGLVDVAAFDFTDLWVD